jgi:hypothetical protein
MSDLFLPTRGPVPATPPFQGPMPPQQTVPNAYDPSTALAKSMMDLRQSTQQQAESQAAYERSGKMIDALAKQNEIAPHWTGVAAAGIRGYVMRKEMQKAAGAAKKQAEAEAAQVAAEQNAELAAADLEWQRELEKQAIGHSNSLELDARKGPSVMEYEQEGFDLKARDPKTLKPDEQMRLKAFNQYLREKGARSSAVGGEPYMTTAEESRSQDEISITSQQLDQTSAIAELYDPELMGMKGATYAKYGNILDRWDTFPLIGKGAELVGQLLAGENAPQEAKDFYQRRVDLFSNVLGLTNRILLERSGAAVTAPEFERFKGEFPVGAAVGPIEFETKFNNVVDTIMALREQRLRQGGWTLDPQNGVRQLRPGEQPNYGNHMKLGGQQPEPVKTESLDDVYIKAREAVRQGADPAAVKARLNENGYDPNLL